MITYFSPDVKGIFEFFLHFSKFFSVFYFIFRQIVRNPPFCRRRALPTAARTPLFCPRIPPRTTLRQGVAPPPVDPPERRFAPPRLTVPASDFLYLQIFFNGQRGGITRGDGVSTSGCGRKRDARAMELNAARGAILNALKRSPPLARWFVSFQSCTPFFSAGDPRPPPLPSGSRFPYLQIFPMGGAMEAGGGAGGESERFEMFPAVRAVVRAFPLLNGGAGFPFSLGGARFSALARLFPFHPATDPSERWFTNPRSIIRRAIRTTTADHSGERFPALAIIPTDRRDGIARGAWGGNSLLGADENCDARALKSGGRAGIFGALKRFPPPARWFVCFRSCTAALGFRFRLAVRGFSLSRALFHTTR